jgi:hypothetical protein
LAFDLALEADGLLLLPRRELGFSARASIYVFVCNRDVGFRRVLGAVLYVRRARRIVWLPKTR